MTATMLKHGSHKCTLTHDIELKKKNALSSEKKRFCREEKDSTRIGLHANSAEKKKIVSGHMQILQRRR